MSLSLSHACVDENDNVHRSVYKTYKLSLGKNQRLQKDPGPCPSCGQLARLSGCIDRGTNDRQMQRSVSNFIPRAGGPHSLPDRSDRVDKPDSSGFTVLAKMMHERLSTPSKQRSNVVRWLPCEEADKRGQIHEGKCISRMHFVSKNRYRGRQIRQVAFAGYYTIVPSIDFY